MTQQSFATSSGSYTTLQTWRASEHTWIAGLFETLMVKYYKHIHSCAKHTKLRVSCWSNLKQMCLTEKSSCFHLPFRCALHSGQFPRAVPCNVDEGSCPCPHVLVEPQADSPAKNIYQNETRANIFVLNDLVFQPNILKHLQLWWVVGVELIQIRPN